MGGSGRTSCFKEGKYFRFSCFPGCQLLHPLVLTDCLDWFKKILGESHGFIFMTNEKRIGACARTLLKSCVLLTLTTIYAFEINLFHILKMLFSNSSASLENAPPWAAQ